MKVGIGEHPSKDAILNLLINGIADGELLSLKDRNALWNLFDKKQQADPSINPKIENKTKIASLIKDFLVARRNVLLQEQKVLFHEILGEALEKARKVLEKEAGHQKQLKKGERVTAFTDIVKKDENITCCNCVIL